MNIELIDNPDQIEELHNRAMSWPEKAEAVEIKCQEDYDAAGFLAKGLTALEKEIDETIGPIVEQANKTHKAACKLRNDSKNPVTSAKKMIRQKMGAYERAQEIKRQAEQRRLEEIARKADEEARLAAAVELEAAGELEAAEQVIESKPTTAPVVSLPPAVKKVEGLRSTRKTYHAKVVDKQALIEFCAANPMFSHLVTENMPELNAIARRQKGDMSIPGVESVEVRS